MNCLQCASEQIGKNGSIHNGKQKHKCKRCGRQFVEHPQWRQVSDETKAPIQKLLCERISLAGIVRVTGVSARWLQSYVNELSDQQPRQTTVRSKKRRLTLQCDKLWSFVGKRSHNAWVWLAMGTDTRKVVAVHAGSRRTMRQALNVVAEILTAGPCELVTLPWGLLRFQHTQAVRAALQERLRRRNGK